MMRLPKSTVDTVDEATTNNNNTGSSAAFGEFVTQLGSNDVLVGRGAPSNANLGNKKFRELVQNRKREYMATGKRQMKDRIAREIVDTIVFQRGGRFLRKIESLIEAEQIGVPEGLSAWTLVSEDVAVQKTKQALRDRDIQGSGEDGGGEFTGGRNGSPTSTPLDVNSNVVGRGGMGRSSSGRRGGSSGALVSTEVASREMAGNVSGNMGGGSMEAEANAIALAAAGLQRLPPHFAAAAAVAARHQQHHLNSPGNITTGISDVNDFLRNSRYGGGNFIGDAGAGAGAGAGMNSATTAEIHAALSNMHDSRAAAAMGQSLRVHLSPPASSALQQAAAAAAGMHPSTNPFYAGRTNGFIPNFSLLLHQQQQLRHSSSLSHVPSHALSALFAGCTNAIGGPSGVVQASGTAGSTSNTPVAKSCDDIGDTSAATAAVISAAVARHAAATQQLTDFEDCSQTPFPPHPMHDSVLQATAITQGIPGGGIDQGSTTSSSLSTSSSSQSSRNPDLDKYSLESRGDAALREALDRHSKDGISTDTAELLSVTRSEVNLLFALCSYGLPLWTISSFAENEDLSLVEKDTNYDNNDAESNDIDKRFSEEGSNTNILSTATPILATKKTLTWQQLAQSAQTIAMERATYEYTQRKDSCGSSGSVNNNPEITGVINTSPAVPLSSSSSSSILEDWVQNPCEFAKRSVMLLEKLRYIAETRLTSGRRRKADFSSSAVDGNTVNKASIETWMKAELCRWAASLQIGDGDGRPIPYSAYNFLTDNPMYKDHETMLMVAQLEVRSCKDILSQIACLTRLRSVLFAKHRNTTTSALHSTSPINLTANLQTNLERAIVDCEGANKTWTNRPSWWGADGATDDILLLSHLCNEGFRGFHAEKRKIQHLKEEFEKKRFNLEEFSKEVTDTTQRATMFVQNLVLSKVAVQERVEQLLEFLHEYQSEEDCLIVLKDRQEHLFVEARGGLKSSDISNKHQETITKSRKRKLSVGNNDEC